MIAYVDSSVILRLVLGEPGPLGEWATIHLGVTSALAEIECLRTIDRLRLLHGLGNETVAERRASVFRLLAPMKVVELSRPIMTRAAESFPTPLGTLDALHLATALLWRDQERSPLVMTTHDAALALAARASGLEVLGV